MIVGFLEVTFSRHGTCKLLCDTSLALARSSPTRRYTGIYMIFYLFISQNKDFFGKAIREHLFQSQESFFTDQPVQYNV